MWFVAAVLEPVVSKLGLQVGIEILGAQQAT